MATTITVRDGMVPLGQWQLIGGMWFFKQRDDKALSYNQLLIVLKKIPA